MSTFNHFSDSIPVVALSESVISSIFIITSTSISEINLNYLILVDPKNIYVSPFLATIIRYRYLKINILIFFYQVQNRSQNTSIQGGGLYRLTGHFDNFKLSKILSSPSHGIKQVGDYIFVVNEDLGVAVFDQKLQVVNSFPLPKGLRPHGIDYCHESNNWVFACSLEIAYQSIMNHLRRLIRFSLATSETILVVNHNIIQMMFVNGKLALCSMFSLSGDFKRGIYDGGVLIIDIVERKVVGSIYGDLSHPHNIQFYGFRILDFRFYTQRVLKALRFIHGYCHFFVVLTLSDGTLLLGQSKNRNFYAISDTSTRPSFLDTSIVVLSPDRLIAKTLPLPSSVSEIHAIFSLRK